LWAAIALLSSASAAHADAAPPSQNRAAQSPKPAKTLASAASMSASDFSRCVSDLMSEKVVFQQPGAVREDGCALSGAVTLSTIPTPFGSVTLSGKPTMLCSFGRQFSGWVRDVAAPLTFAYTGRKLAEIEIGSSFSCRARTDKPGAIPSEHAKGDAVDVMSFVLADQRRVRVEEQASDDPQARALVHALRMTACGYFTTVLGPGADAAHEAHLHFDSAVHGATPNYRICE
jgi:hypothetical protein